MSDESKVTKEDIMEQLQAGHRARLDGSVLQNFNKGAAGRKKQNRINLSNT